MDNINYEGMKTMIQAAAVSKKSIVVKATLNKGIFIQGSGLSVTREYSYGQLVYRQEGVKYDTEYDFRNDGVTDCVNVLRAMVGGCFDISSLGQQDQVYEFRVSTTKQFEGDLGYRRRPLKSSRI